MNPLTPTQKYSWVKGLRYEGTPMEVGPLSRMLVAYASGHKRIKEVVDEVLKKLGVGPEALFSTLGRIAARGIETLVTAEMIPVWIGELNARIKTGDLRIHNGEKWDPSTWPKEAKGYGLHEAPRALSATGLSSRTERWPITRRGAQHMEWFAQG